jgi:acetyl-CoA C-acetyltransferase
MSMAAHAISHAVSKSGVEPEAVEDVYLGNGAHGAANLARLAGLLAGLPVTTGGATIQRHCSSGLNAIALAANYIKTDSADVVVAGGVESITMPGGGMGGSANIDQKLLEMYPAIFMPMIETADIVAKRYDVSREYQDEYSLQSQQRMAAAQAAGLFADEIVPMSTTMKKVDKETKEESFVDYVVDRDECNRPDTTLEGLASLPPVRGEGNFITAGNASQLSDGAAAVVLMSDEEGKRGLTPLGAFRAGPSRAASPTRWASARSSRCELARTTSRSTTSTSGARTRAFASQCLYARDTLGIDPAKYNVNGGSIAIGHPFGMTGAAAPTTSCKRASAARRSGASSPCASAAARARRPLRDLLVTAATPVHRPFAFAGGMVRLSRERLSVSLCASKPSNRGCTTSVKGGDPA